MKVKHYVLVIYIGFLARLMIAVWNGFFGPSPAADMDAQGLFGMAIDISQLLQFEAFDMGYVPYINILGAIFHYTIPSLFLGSVISCFAWLWAAHVFLKILDLMGATSRAKFQAAVIYSFYPASVFLTSVTLREPFQLLFLTLSVYSMLKIYKTGNPFRFINLATYVFLMGVLHGVYLITGIAILGMSLILYAVKNNYKIPYAKIFFYSALLVAPLIYLVTWTFTFSYDFSDGIVKAAISYQEGALNDGVDGRTNYKTSTDFSGISGLLSFILFGFVQYMFKPFLWNVSTLTDIVVMFEGILRFYLLWKVYKNFKNRSFDGDLSWIFILLIYLLNEFIWSLGTINWGTAMRHHVPVFFCLLTVAFSLPGESRRLKLSKGHQPSVDINIASRALKND
jgi:hypothetical protein